MKPEHMRLSKHGLIVINYEKEKEIYMELAELAAMNERTINQEVKAAVKAWLKN